MADYKNRKKKKIRKIILIVIGVSLLLSAAVIGMILLNERAAAQPLDAYEAAYRDTIISITDNGDVEILPLKENDPKTGIIFYAGAQIEPQAYIPLLARLSEQGYCCFIPNLTSNMAALEPNAAEQVIRDHPEISRWYIAGHSMGGLTASGYADDHRNEIDGLIFIAAYSNRDMSDANIPVLAVFGDTDGVMNKELYDERLIWNPKDFEEHIIPGANHAQFGDYGEQPGDNEAKITAEEQQRQTADIILDWLSRHGS